MRLTKEVSVRKGLLRVIAASIAGQELYPTVDIWRWITSARKENLLERTAMLFIEFYGMENGMGQARLGTNSWGPDESSLEGG